MSSHHPPRFALAAVLWVALFPAVASAVTTQGILPASETWSGSVTIQGDVTVPSGVTLTIAPGATISFATTDSMGSGRDTSRPELIVKGTLTAQGSAAQPITLSRVGSTGNWYGITVESGGQAALQQVTISYPRIGVRSDGTLTFTRGTVSHAYNQALWIGGGTAEVSYSTLQNNTYGVYNGGGTLKLHHNSLVAHRYYGMYISSGTANIHHNVVRGGCTTSYTYAVELRLGSGTFDHNTVAFNSGCARAVSMSAGFNMTFKNNIIAKNGQYGLYAPSGASTSYNLVWGHSQNLYGASNKQGGMNYNPLFVSQTDLQLTHRSPARKADDSGNDMGALPYVSAQTTALHGFIFKNLTLPAGTHQVPGDLVVTKGVTLTLAPGATLVLATTDDMAGGNDEQRTGILVQGTISAAGTASSPITLRRAGSSGRWDTVYIASSGKGTFAHTTLDGADYGLFSDGDLTFKNGAIKNSFSHGVYIAHGTFELSYSALEKNTYGVYLRGQTASVHHNTIVGGRYYALYHSRGDADIHHNELQGNCTTSYTYAVQLSSKNSANNRFEHNTVAYNSGCARAISFGTAAGTSFTNNIVAKNGQYGLYAPSGANTSYNLVWGHTQDTYGASNQSGVSANPLFVSTTDLHLQAASPARKAASDGSDLGCYPYQTGPLARLVIAPASASLEVKKSATFSATGYDAQNNVVPATVSWSASAGGTISKAGVFSAGTKAGTFKGAVQAKAGGVSGTADVTVQPGPVAKVTVTPAQITVAPGGSSTFSAVVADAQGNPRTDKVSWKVSPAQAGTISAGGLFKAGTKAGTYADAVTATAGGKTGKATVIIKAGALHHLEISPKLATLKPSAASAFSVVGRDGAGKQVAVNPSWKVVQGGGTITNGGVFVAGTRAGTYVDTVKATASGLSVTATVVVEHGSLAKIAVSPAHSTLEAGATAQFSAKGSDAWDNPVTLAKLSWSASARAGTITAGGLFTAGKTAGDYPTAVTASMDGVSGSAGVRIKDGTTQPIDPNAGGEDGGCTLSPASGGAPWPALALLLALLCLRRRRR